MGHPIPRGGALQDALGYKRKSWPDAVEMPFLERLEVRDGLAMGLLLVVLYCAALLVIWLLPIPDEGHAVLLFILGFPWCWIILLLHPPGSLGTGAMVVGLFLNGVTISALGFFVVMKITARLQRRPPVMAKSKERSQP